MVAYKSVHCTCEYKPPLILQKHDITLLHCMVTNELKHYSPQANVVCVVYDVTSEDSLERVSVVFLIPYKEERAPTIFIQCSNQP